MISIQRWRRGRSPRSMQPAIHLRWIHPKWIHLRWITTPTHISDVPCMNIDTHHTTNFENARAFWYGDQLFALEENK